MIGSRGWSVAAERFLAENGLVARIRRGLLGVLEDVFRREDVRDEDVTQQSLCTEVRQKQRVPVSLLKT